ncbi:unnamed protein product, partial [Gulo gulo]
VISSIFCHCYHIFKNVDTAEEEKGKTNSQIIFSDNLLEFSIMANTIFTGQWIREGISELHLGIGNLSDNKG